MNDRKLLLSSDARLVEVILFLENEPLDVDRIARLSRLEPESVHAALGELAACWSSDMHGLELVESTGTYCFAPAADLHDRLRDCYG